MSVWSSVSYWRGYIPAYFKGLSLLSFPLSYHNSRELCPSHFCSFLAGTRSSFICHGIHFKKALGIKEDFHPATLVVARPVETQLHLLYGLNVSLLLMFPLTIADESTGDSRWYAPIEKVDRSITQTVLHSCYRPLQLLTLEPILIPIGLFSFGWTVSPSIHWIVPIICSAFFGGGIFLTFTGIFTFLADAYPSYAASALAANVFVRCVFAAAFPLFGDQSEISI